MQIQTHKNQHGSDLGEATTFPLIVYYVLLHKAHIQMAFCPRTSICLEIIEVGTPELWGPITLCANLWWRWGLKQSCSPHRELFNDMSHATWTQWHQVDFQLLVVKSRFVNLTPNLSFGHNLCFRCPNGSCKPILDIYVPRAFKWYKELPNPMGFDFYNCSLKIRESIETPTPKMGAHLGVGVFILSHSPTLSTS
jgi:hypothetical protein